MNILFEEHQEILEYFIRYNVDFLLIGGYAVNYYGYMRTTGDMDLWIRPSEDNKIKVLSALEDLGVDPSDVKLLAKQDFTKRLIFSVGTPPVKVDFITHVHLVKFSDAFEQSHLIDMDGLSFRIVRYHDLITMKINTGRIKDKADIEHLQRINKGKNKK